MGGFRQKALAPLAALFVIGASAIPAAASAQTVPGTVQANLEARGLIRQDGYFPIYLDDQTGGFLVEVPADRLGQEILAYTLVEQGQESDISPGIPDRSILIRLEERRGGRLDIIEVDPTVRYDPNSALAKRAAAAKPKVVLGTARIATEEGEGDDRTLFVDGMALIVAASGGAFEPQPQQRSQPMPPEVVSAESFPQNLDVLLDSDEPERALFRFPWEGMPDTVRVRRRVSLVALPELGVATRLADPRVGYFQAEVRDPSKIGRDTAERYIRRFRLEKKDQDAALSEPVKPIVFWMENSTPVAFRPAVEEAVLAWNLAFEAAGFKDAVVVRQMPDDADWSPGDIRYNVLRWVAKDVEFLYGRGPSVYDPRTGETLGADIYLGYSLFAGRMITATDADSVRLGRLDPGFDDTDISPAMLEKVRNTVIHEVGHTLGLRHNFRASTWLPMDGFLDASAQDRQGTASVMDYMPIHIAKDGDVQGRYIDGTPGPYDIWAIGFGYDPDLADASAREAYLARSTEAGLAYASDLEAMGGRLAIDPRVQRRDATADPVAYAAYQIDASRDLMTELLSRQARTGIAQGAFRSSYALAARQRRGAALVAARFVGGIYVDPLVPNQPRTGAVYTPVPAERQREALAVVEEGVFRQGAFDEDVAIAPYLQDAATRYSRPDVEGQALSTQRTVLRHLLDPATLERMSDAGFYGGDYPPATMLRDLNEIVIGGDLKGTPDTVRRNAQITYVEALVALSRENSAKPVVRTAALSALRDIRGRMGLTDLLMKPAYKAHRAHVGRLLDEAGA